MDETTRAHVENLQHGDRDAQNAAFAYLIEATEQPVGWAYDVWDALLADLGHRDNHRRAIAAQVLANLAKSDPEQRMLGDFPRLLAVTRDERFVTARHCLQALWKIGVAGEPQRRMVVAGLTERFRECGAEKNGTLIRYDIAKALRSVYDASGDPAVRATALELIAAEDDPKYRKKYLTLWRER